MWMAMCPAEHLCAFACHLRCDFFHSLLRFQCARFSQRERRGAKRIFNPTLQDDFRFCPTPGEAGSGSVWMEPRMDTKAHEWDPRRECGIPRRYLHFIRVHSWFKLKWRAAPGGNPPLPARRTTAELSTLWIDIHDHTQRIGSSAQGEMDPAISNPEACEFQTGTIQLSLSKNIYESAELPLVQASC